MKQREYYVEGHRLAHSDREVIAVWCGQAIPVQGDFTLWLTAGQQRAFSDLLVMLGHRA